MLRRIDFRWAGLLCLSFFGIIIIYHLLILVQLIPYSMTWGGRLESVEQMYQFESVSLVLNILFVYIALTKMRMAKREQPSKVINILLWIMATIFALNTLGNLFSLNSLEAFIFTPVTFILSVLCIRLAIE